MWLICSFRSAHPDSQNMTFVSVLRVFLEPDFYNNFIASAV